VARLHDEAAEPFGADEAEGMFRLVLPGGRKVAAALAQDTPAQDGSKWASLPAAVARRGCHHVIIGRAGRSAERAL